MWSENKFPITFEDFEHVLSEPTELWTGRKGRINAEIIKEAVVGKENFRIYICGPEGFTEETMK